MLPRLLVVVAVVVVMGAGTRLLRFRLPLLACSTMLICQGMDGVCQSKNGVCGVFQSKNGVCHSMNGRDMFPGRKIKEGAEDQEVEGIFFKKPTTPLLLDTSKWWS